MRHETYHLEGPDSADPNLECAVNAFDILKINAFPPASASGFAPEQQQLLRHTDGVGVGVAANIGAQTSQSDTANDGLVRLSSTVTPGVVMVEAAKNQELAGRSEDKRIESNSPSGQHLDKMLLSGTGLLALTETTENTSLLQQSATGSTLDLDHLGVTNVASRRNDVKVEIFTQDDDASSVLQHVSSITLHGLDGHGGLVAREGRWGVIGGGGGDCLGDGSEELEHVLQRSGVILGMIDRVR